LDFYPGSKKRKQAAAVKAIRSKHPEKDLKKLTVKAAHMIVVAAS
jgi:hypothetical protein